MIEEYDIHMISFRSRKNKASFNVVFSNGGNLEPWHLERIEQWLIAQKTKERAQDIL